MAGVRWHTQQPRLGRTGVGKREESVVGKRLSGAQKVATERGELMVERQSAQMRSHHRNLDAASRRAQDAACGGALEPSGDTCEIAVRARAADEGEARGKSIASCSHRHRDRGEVEQV